MANDTEDLPHHHYIPVFYLKGWTTPGSRLHEFSRQYGSIVRARPTSPVGTGYEPGLYRLHGVPDELAEEFERKFFGQVDNMANEALQILLGKSNRAWTPRLRKSWAIFLAGTLFRVPERVRSARVAVEDDWLNNYDQRIAEYEAWKTPEHPDFLEYIVTVSSRATMLMVEMVIDHPVIRPFIEGMRWFVIDCGGAGHRLFTSDRPIAMSNGLEQSAGYIAMPISPTRVFVACNTVEQEQFMRSIPPRELVKQLNRHVIRRAARYAWNTDKDEITFVDKHLSKDHWMDIEYFDSPPNRPTSTPR
jgi:hypothetical protein